MIVVPRRVPTMTSRTKILLGLTLVCSTSLTVLLGWSLWGNPRPAWELVIFAMVWTLIFSVGLIASLHVDSVNRATGVWAKRILMEIDRVADTIDDHPAMDVTNVRHLRNMRR